MAGGLMFDADNDGQPQARTFTAYPMPFPSLA
jgi:hypothetical protein